MCQPLHKAIVLFVLEEKFAQAVCFLLVDMYLLTFQPEKALHLLAVLDKLSAQGSHKNGKGEVHHCSTKKILVSHKMLLFFLWLVITFYCTVCYINSASF